MEAVRAAELPQGTPYAWIAGEASGVRALDHHLIRERGFGRERVTCAEYWRRGLSEDQSWEAVAPARAAGSGAVERPEGKREGRVEG